MIMDALFAVLAALLICLIPGFHINAFAAVALPYIHDPPFFLIMAGAYAVLGIIPLVIFKVGEEGIASMPAVQKLSASGKGAEAVSAYLFGAFLGGITSLLFPAGVFTWLQDTLKPWYFWILLFASLVIVLKSKNLLLTAVFFILSALVGYVSLTSAMPDKFLPMFSGFFAVPFLLLAVPSGTFPVFSPKFEKWWVAAAVCGIPLGAIALLLPGISSPSVVGIAGYSVFSGPAYVALIGSITASQYVLSALNYEETGKTRIGILDYAIKSSGEGKEGVRGGDGVYVAGGIVLGLAVALIFFSFLRPSAPGTGKLVLIYIACVVLALDGVYGLAIMAASAGIGFLAKVKDIPPTALLGSIIGITMHYLSFGVF